MHGDEGRRPGSKHPPPGERIVEQAQHDDLTPGRCPAERGDQLVLVIAARLEMHQDHVGTDHRRLPERGEGVLGLPNDRQVGSKGEPHLQAPPERRLLLDNEKTDHSSS
jgi:hypothetical protein